MRSLSFPAGCLVLFAMVAAAAPGRAEETPMTPRAGEIRLDGTLRSVDPAQNTLVLNVTSFLLPSGKKGEMVEPKPKVVILSDGTELRRGRRGQRIAPSDLLLNAFTSVVGPDLGSGRELPARLVTQADPQEKVSSFERRIKISPEAAELNRQGMEAFRRRRYDLALDFFNRAMDSTQAEGRAFIAHNAAAVLRRLHQPQKAVALYDEAIAYYRGAGDVANQLREINSASIALREAGEFEKAVASLEEALRLARELKDREIEADTLFNLAYACNDLPSGESRALQYFERALPLWNTLKDREHPLLIWRGIGQIHVRQGRLPQAVEAYRQALALAQELRDKGAEAELYNLLGVAHAAGENYEPAIEAFEHARSYYEGANATESVALTLRNLGYAHNGQGQFQRAGEILERALSLSRELKDKAGEISALKLLAKAQRGLKRPQEAAKSLQLAITLAQELGDDETARALREQLEALRGPVRTAPNQVPPEGERA